MKVLAVDLETTSLDWNTGWIIEIGAVVFDGLTWEPLRSKEMLVREDKAFPLTQEIKEITKITDEMLLKDGLLPVEAFVSLQQFVVGCDVVIAHNTEFDFNFLKFVTQRSGFAFNEEFMGMPWYCSKNDIKTHYNRKCTKLAHLAVDYGLQVDGSTLHRALEDVRLMGRMLKATGFTMPEIIAWVNEPWVYMKADVKEPWKDGKRSTTLAKAEGFTWERANGDSTVFSKSWVKRLKKKDFEEFKHKKLNFDWEVIQKEQDS